MKNLKKEDFGLGKIRNIKKECFTRKMKAEEKLWN